MDRLIGRLEQCKGSLQLAHQLYMGARNMSRFDYQDRALEDLRNSQLTLVSQCMTKAICQASFAHEPQTSQVVLTETATTSTPREQRLSNRREVTTSKRHVLSIRLRGWNISRVLELAVAQVPAGWTASLQFYRIVQWSDPFLVACMSNNLVAVKEMLQAKKATVYDTNDDGMPAIDFAMVFASFDVGRYLYQHGVVPTDNDFVVARFCTLCYSWPASKQLTWATSKDICVDALGQLGIDQSDDVFEHPLVQLWVTPSESLSVDERLDLMIQIVILLPDDIEALHRKWDRLMEIGGSPFDMALFDAMSYGDTLFGVLAMLFARCFSCSTYEANGEQPLLADVTLMLVRGLTHGADLTARMDKNDNPYRTLTPLGTLLCSFIGVDQSNAASQYNLLLRKWVQMLANCGVDLLAYGESEVAAKCDYSTYDNIVRISGFAYGSEPKDWQLFFWAENDHHIGQFWRMVEEPERHVPGAWVEGDSDEEDW